MYWNIILWIQWFYASFIYFPVLEEFSTCCHELLLLMQVTELDIFWKMFVLVNRNLVLSSEKVVVPTVSLCWCWTRRIQGGREDVGLRLGKDMQQILPLLLFKNCKEFLQQRCVSHVNLIMGCVVREIDSQWGHFSLHIAVGPLFNVPFQWPQVNTLSAKFPPFKIFIALLSKCTSPKGNLKYRFHSHQINTYLNFNMLVVVCNADVLRVCNIKNNFGKKKHVTEHKEFLYASN
jgi:hypothetical protein